MAADVQASKTGTPANTAGACPFLGLEKDPPVMLSVPSAAHRCFAGPVVTALDPEHQQRVCLVGAHGYCPLYLAAVRAGNPPAVRYGRPRTAARTRRHGRQWRGGRWLVPVMGALLLMAIATASLVLQGNQGSVFWPEPVRTAAAEVVAEATPEPATARATETPQATAPEATAAHVVALPTNTPQVGAAVSVALLLPTVTPHGGDPQTLALQPAAGQVGWWRSGATPATSLGDSFLYAGALPDGRYVSAFLLNIDNIPRGAPLLSAELALTGLRDDQLAVEGAGSGGAGAASTEWLVQLAAAEAGGFATMTPDEMATLATSIILPPLAQADLARGAVNRWALDRNALDWLASLRERDVRAVVVRLSMQRAGEDDAPRALFAWDSGQGPKSSGAPPTLLVNLGPAPATPPPVPTADLLVATTTPTPVNIATVAALQQTATFVAQTTGTFTPMPPYATPTPLAQSVATAQAIARMLGQPAVVLETPTPANAATEMARQAEATFVALTTGTFTPVPTAYVTPVLVVASPPALNMATAVARDEAARAAAAAGTPEPLLPYNAVVAQWVEATPTPQNVATAAALALQATADAERLGPATATPWGRVVYTPQPPIATTGPTATPTPPLVESVVSWTPTPVILPTEAPPSELPANLRGLVLFRSNRLGLEETYAWDPATGVTARINAAWAWPLAAQQIAPSPDGQSVAIVKADNRGLLQVYVRSLAYGTETQVTNFSQQGEGTRSYDPAWSPTGDWIAFVSTNSGNDEIYRVSPDGSVVQQLTFNQWEWDKHPTFSPDGAQIVFYSNRETQRRQLWIMNADGSDQRALAPSPGDDWDPVWTR